jgi:hypothetical protein
VEILRAAILFLVALDPDYFKAASLARASPAAVNRAGPG